MYLNDVAMVASDTTRSLCYLEGLIKNKLLPSFVLLLKNDQELLPGQKDNGLASDIVNLLKIANIQFSFAPNNKINSNEVVQIISDRNESVFIFSGYGGVLLGDNILNLGKFFLHVHGGYLPAYKGSTTNYYSLIKDGTLGASSIFLNKNIDCGPILLRKKFPAPSQRSEIDHIYDSEVRTNVLIATLKNYVDSGCWNFNLKENQGGETYYIIHPLLKHIAILADEPLL